MLLKSTGLLLLTGALLMTSPALAGKRTEDVEVLVITSASNRGEVDPCG